MRRQLLTGLFVTIALIIVTSVVYPLAVWGVGRVAFRHQTDGSFVKVNGKVVGSALIGQGWSDKDGNPLSNYFQPRPSAAGDGYDPTSSSGTNLGPTNPKLIQTCLPVQATDADGNPKVDTAGNPVYQTNADGTQV